LLKISNALQDSRNSIIYIVCSYNSSRDLKNWVESLSSTTTTTNVFGYDPQSNEIDNIDECIVPYPDVQFNQMFDGIDKYIQVRVPFKNYNRNYGGCTVNFQANVRSTPNPKYTTVPNRQLFNLS